MKKLLPDANDRELAGYALDLRHENIPDEWLSRYLDGTLPNQQQVQAYTDEVREFTNQIADYTGLPRGKRLDYYLTRVLDRQAIASELKLKIKEAKAALKGGKSWESPDGRTLSGKQNIQSAVDSLRRQYNTATSRHFDPMNASTLSRYDLEHLGEGLEFVYNKKRGIDTDALMLRHIDDILPIYAHSAARWKYKHSGRCIRFT